MPKKIKMLEAVTIAGRSVAKHEVCELDDELADGFVNSKLAESVEDEAEDKSESSPKRKKK